MAKGSKKFGRLVDVFRDLAVVERAKVADLAREMDALRDMQDAIFRQLEKPASFHGPFMGLFSSRIGKIERQIGSLAIEHEAALKRFTEASARERSASQLAADARADEARQQEQRDLEVLLEFAQGRARSG